MSRPLPRTLLLLGLVLAGCAGPGDETDTGDQDSDTGTDDSDTADSGDSDTGTANTAPTATDDAVSTDEDTPTVVITLLANDTDADGDPLDVTAIGTAGMTGSATLGEDNTVTWHPGAAFQTLGAGASNTTTLTYTVSDGDLTDTGTVTITVAGVNDAPILTPPVNQTSDEGALINLPVVVADPDDATLAWSATGLPPGLSISGTTGRITGRLTSLSFKATPYAITVTADDGVATDDVAFSWTVNEANVPPIFDEFGNRTSAEGDLINLSVHALDPEEVAVGYSDPTNSLPPGIGISAGTGALTGTIGYAAAANSPYTVSIRASDGAVFADLEFTWTVTNVNRPPDVTSPGTQSSAEGDIISGLQVPFTDPDTDDTLAFSSTDLAALGLSIAPTTGIISGTLPYTAAGSHNVKVTVSDGTDTDNVTFTWNVTNTNRLPVVTGPSNQSSAEGQIVSVGVSATDPDGSTLSYSVTGLPPAASGATMGISSTTGVISGTIGFTSAGSHDVKVTVSDGTGSVEWPFTWTVSPTNRPPVFSNVKGRLDEEGTTITSFTLTVSDPDGDDVDFSATNLPTGIQINAETGLISGTVSYDAAGSTGTATWQTKVTATDGIDDTAAEFDWDIDAVNRAPEVEDIGDQGDAEGTTKNIAVTAPDPDGDTIASWQATNLPPGLSIVRQTDGSARIVGTITFDAAANSPYQFTLVATDANGLPGQATFNYTVDNADPPACEWHLEDMTERSGLTMGQKGTAVAWLDLEDDGDGDLFVRNVGVFQNDDGVFTDVTEELGIDPGTGDFGVSIGDIDGDGGIDLLVPNDNLDGRDGIPTRLYTGSKSTVFGWEDIAPQLKIDLIDATPGCSVFHDVDSDYDLDLTFASSIGPAYQFFNVRDFPMADGTEFFDGDLFSDNGVAWADFDQDGDHDAFVTNGRNEGADALFVQYVEPKPGWKDEAGDRKVMGDENNPQSGGATWVDLDADGLLDLHLVLVDADDLVHIQQEDHTFSTSKASALGLGDSDNATSSAVWGDYDEDGWLDVLLPDKGIWHNKGGGKGFTDVTATLGYEPSGIVAGAWGDYDGDVDVDLVVVGVNGIQLYEAVREGSSATCTVAGRRRIAPLTDLDGGSSSDSADYAAIGTRIDVDLDGNGDFKADGDLSVWLIGQAMSGRAAVNHLFPIIGLGEGTGKVDVRVTFPDGDEVVVENVVSSKPTLTVLDPGGGVIIGK